jgi:hypothetical protein
MKIKLIAPHELRPDTVSSALQLRILLHSHLWIGPGQPGFPTRRAH